MSEICFSVTESSPHKWDTIKVVPDERMPAIGRKVTDSTFFGVQHLSPTTPGDGFRLFVEGSLTPNGEISGTTDEIILTRCAQMKR